MNITCRGFAKLLTVAVLSGGFCVLSATMVQAQYGYGEYGGGHSSTAAEGYQRGLSDVIRSTGQANLLNSQANINNQTAISQNLDNHLKYTNTYFEMRSANRQAKAAEASPQLSTDQLYRMAETNSPKRPGPSQLDPITGQIAWPIALRDNYYALEINALSDLFVYRADHHGYIGMDAYTRIANAGKSLTAKLAQNINETPPKDYIAAKRLVESLVYEAGLPTQYTASN